MVGKKTFKNIAKPEYLWGNTIEDIGEVKKNPRKMSIDLTRLFIAARVPITFHGPPGSGKSATIDSFREITDEDGINYNVVSIIPSSTDPTALHGVMYTSYDPESKETMMKRSLPDTAVEIRRMYDEENRLTILMLDEMSTAMISQQHALLNFLTTGKWGELDISECISIVMASNPKGTVMVSRDLDRQLLNRSGHIPWYSQAHEFLEGWKTGWGHSTKAPTSQSIREIEGIFSSQPDKVFRSTLGTWDIDTLVPYEQLELTERSASMYAQVSELIDEVTGYGKSQNPNIRWVYKQKVAEALWGKVWGERMQVVLNNEAKRSIDAPTVIEMTKNVSLDMSLDEVREAVGDVYHHNGQIYPSGEVKSIFNDIYSMLEKDNSRELYTALWAYASLTPRDSDYGMFVDSLVYSLVMGKKMFVNGVLKSKEEIVPPFTPPELKDMVKSMVSM